MTPPWLGALTVSAVTHVYGWLTRAGQPAGSVFAGAREARRSGVGRWSLAVSEVAQLRQGPTEDPRNLHLRNADQLCDLRLR